MPVESDIEFKRIDQDLFHSVDKRVMRHAFDIHNSMGRFFDEYVYQEELAQRCRADGMAADREVYFKVTHRDFSKSYFFDLLIERSGLYELKAVNSLAGVHDKQVINYLLLTGLRHGKLVNMRPSSVESRFVSTTLSPPDRFDFKIETEQFDDADELSCGFRKILCELLNDWGVFLDADLYREALIHFCNETGGSVQPVDVVVGDRVVGSQKLCMLSEHTAWHLSSIKSNHSNYQVHISRLLNHTGLTRIHWVNIDQREITLQTVKK